MPRKSAASTTAPTDANGDVSMVSEAPTTHSPKQTKDGAEKPEKQSKRKSEADAVALEDLLLPRTITQRICKGVLPPNTSIHRDAVLALTKSATVFISLLASEANDMTERKTIQSQDVLKALREIEMGDVMGLGKLGADGKRGGRVEREVERFEGDQRGKRRGYREKVKARESGAGNTTVGTVDEEDAGEREEHENKRVRIDEDGEEGSTGPITNGTSRLKLNMGRRQSDGADEVDKDDVVEDEADEDEEEQEEEDEEEQEEFQDAEETLEIEDTDSQSKGRGTLAPDGRVEVGGSDDESD